VQVGLDLVGGDAVADHHASDPTRGTH
jgi:hypothetical protein